MQGRRVPVEDVCHKDRGRPGDFGGPIEDDRAGTWMKGCWIVRAPDGGAATLNPEVHTVVDHEDGMISVSPSIIMPNGWHGFLRQGVWSGG